MQLLKVQERINALTPSLASLAYLKRAAAGMDTEIPPFMALVGMNEMERDLEYASAGQPPEEPINQSLPKQLERKMGLGQPMQPGQQMQPMQPGQPMQPPGQQLAQGIAQPMQQQMPQQMARGGLASVPIDPRMFDYRSGGIIAFAGDEDGSLVQLGNDFPAGGEREDGDESPVPTTQELNALRKRLEGMMGQPAPTLASADEIRKQLEARNQYGVDPGPVGQKYLRGLDTIQEGQVAEDAKIAEDNARLKNIGISRALIRAGEGTRGGGGIAGLLGAFGESYAGVQEEDIKRSADLRGRDLARAGVLNEATYAIQKLREAQRSGDEKGVMEQNQKLAELANKLNISKNELMGKLFASETGLLKAKIAAGKPRADTKVPEAVLALGQELTRLQQESAADPGNVEKQAAVKVAQERYAVGRQVLQAMGTKEITSNVTSNITTDNPEGGPKDEVAQAEVRVKEAKRVAEDAKTAEEQRLAREKLALEVQKLVELGLNKFKIFNNEYRLLALGSDADKAKAAALLRAEEARLRGTNTPAAAPTPAASSAAPTPAASSAAPRMRFNSAGEPIQ